MSTVCMLAKHLKVSEDSPPLSIYFRKRGIITGIVQPKLNGVRAIWNPEAQVLFTRSGHPIYSVPHLVKALAGLNTKVFLDGELFSTQLSFNQINGASRSYTPTEDSFSLEYHVFDTLEPQVLQYDRLIHQHEKFFPPGTKLKAVPNELAHCEDFTSYLEAFLAQGYEGLIIRNPKALYQAGRHVGNLWAIKPEFELEASFVCFLPPGEGTSLHWDTFGSLQLKLPSNGRLFSCSGLNEQLRQHLWNCQPEVGTKITITFGAWSTNDPETRVPLYPRFKGVRWDS